MSNFDLDSPLLLQRAPVAAADCLEISVDSHNDSTANSTGRSSYLTHYEDEDEFVRVAYQYHMHRGLAGWACTQAAHLLMLAVVFVLFVVLGFMVDYARLMRAREISTAIRSPSFFAWVAIVACIAVWLLKAAHIASQVQRMLAMHGHFRGTLFVDDDAPWKDVVHALHTTPKTRMRQPSDVSGRLLRVEHFMLGMHHAGIFYVELWGNSTRTFMLSAPFQWLAWFTVVPLIMDHVHGHIADTAHAALALRHRMVLVGIIGLCVCPLVLVLVLFYYVLQYGEQLRNRPLFLGSRHWSMEAAWNMRRWHEAPHELRARLAAALKHAHAFADSTASPVLAPLAQLCTFCFSAACVLLLMLAFVDDDVLLRQQLFGRLLVWWLGVAGAGLAVSRACMPRGDQDICAIEELRQVAQHTGLRVQQLRTDWGKYFEYRLMGFVWELAAVVIAPVLFLTIMPRRAMRIGTFLQNNTHACDRIGPVCSLSIDDRIPIVDISD